MSFLEAGVQMMDGMKMAGMIRYFYDHKGFGFINVTGNPIDIYFQGRQKLRAWKGTVPPPWMWVLFVCFSMARCGVRI